jgi:hypothetical protein
MTVHQTYPLNEAARADADLGKRKTTGPNVLVVGPAASRRSFQRIDA